jgi:hypothetical protein
VNSIKSEGPTAPSTTFSSSAWLPAVVIFFRNSFMSGRPTASWNAAATASNFLEEVTLNRWTLTSFVPALYLNLLTIVPNTTLPQL